jgi:sarcosine oxidase
MHWFKPKDPEPFSPDRFPVFIWEFDEGRSVYGFPDLLGTGMKIGIHHEGATVDPDTVDRTVGSMEVQEMQGLVKRFFPLAAGAPVRSVVCLYTDTPDYTFLLDRHPKHDNVVIGSPCSGHGFKFASAVGDVLSQLVMEGTTPFDLSLFRLSRWTGRLRRAD